MAYEGTFKMFLVFMIYFKIKDLTCESSIVIYLEFLIQNGMSAMSLQNALTVLQHYYTHGM